MIGIRPVQCPNGQHDRNSGAVNGSYGFLPGTVKYPAEERGPVLFFPDRKNSRTPTAVTKRKLRSNWIRITADMYTEGFFVTYGEDTLTCPCVHIERRLVFKNVRGVFNFDR